MQNKKPTFIPKDFDITVKGTSLSSRLDCELAAEIANARIEKLIESWPVVYGYTTPNGKSYYSLNSQHLAEQVTHHARLALIQPIEPCKHEPRRELHSHTYSEVCKHCGVEIVATEWKERK